MRQTLLFSILLIWGLTLFFCTGKSHEPSPAVVDDAPIASIQHKIALVPLGFTDTHLTSLLQSEIEAFYKDDVEVMPNTKLPSASYYSPRNRYRADSLIAILARSKSYQHYDKVIGITGKDISTTKDSYADWGIFGLGYCPGKSCVISTFRLKKNARDKEHVNDRVVKVALHELGHTFGLPHCNSSNICLMRDAEGTIKSVDTEEKILCSNCRNKLGI